MSQTVGRQPASYLARFGLSSFRPGQEDVIRALIEGRDCLCVMPTGGGKSLCYQLPSLMRDGLTLVVSPLIALMKDQVDALHALGIRATYINSSLAYAEQQDRLDGMADSAYDLVYIAPERLRSGRFLEALKQTHVHLLAVDEAHCISEWGHDFRPDYARLGRFRSQIGNPQTIALTATATPRVQNDIVALLELRDPDIFITGFARPNLRFEVSKPRNQREKDDQLFAFLKQTPGAGIVYTSSRKRCEEIVTSLTGRIGRNVGMYHAGLAPDDRRGVQDAFMRDEVAVIVATNAFGMGIDKPDLRFVAHYNMPGSLEAYYQEAGRAGRDGDSSRCLLLFTRSDRFIQEFFIDNAYPPRDAVARVYRYLCSLDDDPIEMTQQEIRERLGLSISGEGVGACQQLLEKCGALERIDSRENMAAVRIDADAPSLVDLLPKEARVRRRLLKAVEGIVGDRRFERVYFRVEAIAARAEMERSAVQRALRELNKLRNFDYVPPFRGKGLHVLDRQRPFENLEIDFEELDRRKAAELEKLDRVIQYAETKRCRQADIRGYFGDLDASHCETCDNCERSAKKQNRPPRRAPVDGAGLQAAVLVVLSGVARTQGRFGKTVIAKMLCGSKSEQIARLGLDQLSTFGLLSELKQTDVIALIDALLTGGLLEQVEPQRFRPVVQLTERGSAVMKGQAPCEVADLLGDGLAFKLAGLRIDSPAPALKEPAQYRADDAQSDFPIAGDDDESTQQETPAAHIDNDRQPSHYWTWRLLSAGFTARECEAIRGIDADQVVQHAIEAQRDGLNIELRWFLSTEQMARLSPREDSTEDGQNARGLILPPKLARLVAEQRRGAQSNEKM